MENMNKELQEDRRKNHYVVETKRDTKLMLTFIEFKNRVEHPAAYGLYDCNGCDADWADV